MQSGYIESLQIQRKKGSSFEHVLSVELEAGRGIGGDCHALGGEKQIVLISSKVKKWIMEQELEGLCFLRFQENIVTEGIDYQILAAGDMLATNHTIVEISAYTKQCFPECLRRITNQSCELKTGIRYGKVKQSGNIRVGDRIWQICHIEETCSVFEIGSE